jgi:putative copper resistance protein D
MGPDLQWAQLVATVVLNLAVAVLTGASVSAMWLLGSASQWAAGTVKRLRDVALAAVTAALAADLAMLWIEAAAMAEVPITEAAPAAYTALTATHYGYAWAIGMCALVVAAGATAIRWKTEHARAAGVIRLLAIGLFWYSRSMVSHAAANGDASWAVAADWLHLVLISLWVGGVLVAGLIALRASPGTARADRLAGARYVEALSASATVALAGIVITGIFSAWRGLGSLDNATGNPYASTLLFKLALVACAAMLGGANRFFVMPGLIAQLRGTVHASPTLQRRFALILQIEAIALFAALVLASILSSTSPPTAG